MQLILLIFFYKAAALLVCSPTDLLIVNKNKNEQHTFASWHYNMSIWIVRICDFKEGEGDGKSEGECGGSRVHCYSAVVECIEDYSCIGWYYNLHILRV